jgi:ketosteroid isomerase-like protein
VDDVFFHEEQEMHPTLNSRLVLFAIMLATSLVWAQTPARSAAASGPTKTEDFATAIKRIRDTWLQEFNAGQADKVAALYAPDAVLLRRKGTVHTRDSILAELQRSITAAEAQNYTMRSLHAESSGNLGYDTGIYDETVRHHVAEGNYLMVIKQVEGEWKIAAHSAVPNPRQKY